MINYKKTNLPKNTFQFEITIPKEEVKKTYEQAFVEIAAELELPGFRKGKAPAELAQKAIKKETVANQTVQKLLPQIYQELVKTANLKPITAPKIELLKTGEAEDWQVRATIAEKPAINLKNYQELIKKALAQDAKPKIWTPGQTADAKPKDETKEENQNKRLQIVFSALLKNVKIEIPDLLIEAELEKRLAQLVDDVRRIGLTVEGYLKSKNETIDSLRAKFSKEIEETYILEFALEAIAEEGKIVVGAADLETLFTNIKDEKERQTARQNSYLYATLLRRQKTLEYLTNL